MKKSMICSRCNVVLAPQMCLGRPLVVEMGGALSGMSLTRMVWSVQLFFQFQGVSYASLLPFCLQESTGLTVMCGFLFVFCFFFSSLQHEWA